MKDIVSTYTLEELIEAFRPMVREELDDLLQSEQEKLINRKEAAKLLDISLPTLKSWTDNDKIQSHRRPGTKRVYYKKKELMDFKQNRGK